MLYRKIEKPIYEHLSSDSDKILIVTGARQVGKSYIIRYVGSKLFKNVVEINMVEDKEGDGLFGKVRSLDDFHLALGIFAGEKLGNREDTLVFIDEIQEYPNLLTLLKFLREENKYTYIASGSLLGVSLKRTTSIPIGSITTMHMYPLDFEEFLLANGIAESVIDNLRQHFLELKSLDSAVHDKILGLFKRYLLVGGLPDAVNVYLDTHNLVRVREVHREIHNLYSLDASKYDIEHRLKISRIYDLIPSNLENKKKRLIFKDIENKVGKRADDYVEEIDYLVNSGIALEVRAIANPLFPLDESEQKNLLKLYLNDVGILTSILYRNNAEAILNDLASVNLGSVYECVVASELHAHDNSLFYYDNRTRGEVDYMLNDYENLSVLPVEVKSGKDYKRHSALSRFVSTPDYNIKRAFVLSNSRDVEVDGKIIYIPVYFSMFISQQRESDVVPI